MVQLDEEFAQKFGVDFAELRAATLYLYREDLIETHGSGHLYGLKHRGIVEVEASIRHPERETEHFSPGVISSVTNSFGSNNATGSIQNGGTGNTTAAVTQSVTETANVTKTVIQEIRNKIADLPPEKHEEVHSVIDQIEEAIERGPKLLGAVETMVVGLVKYFPDMLPWLISQAGVIVRSLGGG
jgi:hypothetical protein